MNSSGATESGETRADGVGSRTRTHASARPNTCTTRMQPPTRSGGDAKGRPTLPRARAHEAAPHAPQTPADPAAPDSSHTATGTGRASGLAGPRGPGTHGGLEPQPPVSLDPQCHTTCSRHLPPSWRFCGERAGWAGGGLRAGSGAGSGWGLCSARASVGACVRPSVSPTAQRLRCPTPPPPHMPAPVGGGGAGQSGAPLR